MQDYMLSARRNPDFYGLENNKGTGVLIFGRFVAHFRSISGEEAPFLTEPLGLDKIGIISNVLFGRYSSGVRLSCSCRPDTCP